MTVNQQIPNQIEGRIAIEVHCSDDYKFDYPLYMSLYVQDGKYWIGFAFVKDKQISKIIFDEIAAMFTGEQEFNTDREVIRTDMTEQEFLQRYYHDLDAKK